METKMNRGGEQVPVFVYGDWYVQKGMRVICRSLNGTDDIKDLNHTKDCDAFEWDNPINSDGEFLKALHNH